MHQELEKTRQVVTELEEQLRAERSRLRSLTTEQSKAERQKEAVVLQLQRTESVSQYSLWTCCVPNRTPSRTWQTFGRSSSASSRRTTTLRMSFEVHSPQHLLE